MSRFGKTPILLPSSVEVKVDEKKVYVKGPKGTLDLDLQSGIKIKVDSGKIFIER